MLNPGGSLSNLSATHSSNYLKKRQSLLSRPKSSIVKREAINFLLQAPMSGEIRTAYTAYIIADNLYTNRDHITQLFEEYQRRNNQNISGKIGMETAQASLSTIQTELAWTVIGGHVPKELQKPAKEMLANFMNTLTSAEIALAKQFLQGRE
jgi:hypothetical protein